MYELSAKARFSAAHRLAGYDGSCAAYHGHNWDVEAFVCGEDLDETGILLDFRQLKTALRNVLEELDHKDLNAVPAFRDRNPTSENLARYIFEQLVPPIRAAGGTLDRVSVYETPDTRATYRETATARERTSA